MNVQEFLKAVEEDERVARVRAEAGRDGLDRAATTSIAEMQDEVLASELDERPIGRMGVLRGT